MNLRTRAGIVQAIWDKIKIAEKENVITLDLWFWGSSDLLSFVISNGKMSFHPNCEKLEKVNTMKYLKDVYNSLYSAKDALVCWSNPARKAHLIANWDEDSKELTLH